MANDEQQSNGDGASGSSADQQASTSGQPTAAQVAQIQQQLARIGIQRSKTQAKERYAFWETQPVAQFGAQAGVRGPRRAAAWPAMQRCCPGWVRGRG
jgi:hypothetical protein